MQVSFSFRNAILCFLFAASLSAATIVGPWTPKFKGIDFSVSTNTPGGDFPRRQVVSAFRIDLTDPDIRLLTTPRRSDYVAGSREVGALTVSDFLRTNHVQAAINANFFTSLQFGTQYYLPAGTPMDVFGLQISQGVTVSAQDAAHAAALLFDAKNNASIIYTNWPATNTTGIYTAVAGNDPILINGRNVGKRTDVDPRTAFGLSQDRRYLYLIGIDGRQPGYSEGAYDYETAGWLLLLGAWDGVNMDGGGSTTLVVEGSTGSPVRLNRPSAVADSGKERTVGSHLGIFAKPLPGFINDVTVTPDDTSATVIWNTLQPATSRVDYGITEEFGSDSGLISTLVTNHVVQLTGLTPNTGYYYRVVSTAGSSIHVSSNFYFLTTNYVTTNTVLEITNAWKYATAVSDEVNWTSYGFDDSSWSGPGAGLLWMDVRPAGPNPDVQPKNTQLAGNPSNGGYPYVTYYFRTHFTVQTIVRGSSLALSGFIDDGAVVYLNGAEIWRVRMPDGATSDTIATSYPCEGDATCPDEHIVAAPDLVSLVSGDNVLAVEVHNYNLRSADITFGLTASLIEPIARTASLSVETSAQLITLRWDAAGFHLQSAESPTSKWSDESLTSPASIAPAGSKRFYRLAK